MQLTTLQQVTHLCDNTRCATQCTTTRTTSVHNTPCAAQPECVSPPEPIACVAHPTEGSTDGNPLSGTTLTLTPSSAAPQSQCTHVGRKQRSGPHERRSLSSSHWTWGGGVHGASLLLLHGQRGSQWTWGVHGASLLLPLDTEGPWGISPLPNGHGGSVGHFSSSQWTRRVHGASFLFPMDMVGPWVVSPPPTGHGRSMGRAAVRGPSPSPPRASAPLSHPPTRPFTHSHTLWPTAH